MKAAHEIKRAVEFAEQGDIRGSWMILSSIDPVFDFTNECLHLKESSDFLTELWEIMSAPHVAAE